VGGGHQHAVDFIRTKYDRRTIGCRAGKSIDVRNKAVQFGAAPIQAEVSYYSLAVTPDVCCKVYKRLTPGIEARLIQIFDAAIPQELAQ
jgi:hypothetical protein